MPNQSMPDVAQIEPSTRSPWPYVSAGLVIALLAFAFIGLRGLWEPDEGRYVAVACQMIRSGDWLHPALQDEVPHYTKPPLLYWLLASSMKVIGHYEWAVRLPGALAFAGTIICVGAMARRVMPGRSLTAALLYATSALPFIASNIVTTDTLLTFWETLAMLGFVNAWKALDPKPGNTAQDDAPPGRGFHKQGLWLMWTAYAFAFMTKGPPGLLPLLAMAVVVTLFDGPRGVVGLCRSLGLPLFFLLGLTWYVVVGVQTPGLIHYFIVDEIYGRIATDEHHRNSAWYDAFMYIPMIAVAMLPWSFDWLTASGRHRTAHALKSWRQNTVIALLTLWIAIPLVVFMLAKSRLPLYVLPLMAPLALATASLKPVDWWTSARGRRELITCMVALLGIRLFLGLAPIGRDVRAAQSDFPVTPDTIEVVFVDTTPQYGLYFYLGIPVEYVTAIGRENVPLLTDELGEFEGDLLLVLGPRNETRVTDMLNDFGWTIKTRTPVVVDSGTERIMLEVLPPQDKPQPQP